VKVEIEPMQQPLRKVVGRQRTISQRLVNLENLASFLKKYAHGSFAKIEGDYFPVRKIVGRPRGKQD
jgi:hypothetical protein